MNRPKNLYRFRPLDDSLLERELDALHQSYLYSPSFASMNDPMEAFYETGDVSDGIINAILSPSGANVQTMYDMLSEMVRNFALISFAGSHEDLPLWAYYASNFAGLCLEFDSENIGIGDLQNEDLRPVTYARSPLPRLSTRDLTGELLQDAVVGRTRYWHCR